MSDNNNNEDVLKSDEIYPCRRGKILRNVKGVIEYKGGYYRETKYTHCNCGHSKCDSSYLIQYCTYRAHLKRQRVNHASSQVEFVEPTNPTWVYKYRQLTRKEILHAQMVLKNRMRLRGLVGDGVGVPSTDKDP